MPTEQEVAVLTIAGSDSSGGAGIQADLKTFAALGCYGTSALTAITAQNTTGVQGVHACPPDFVSQQITSVLDDIHISAIKTGMLSNAEIVTAITSTLKSHYTDPSKLPPIVCDPVCVSTSGHTLLHQDALRAITTELFPISKLITPNKSEADLLLSHLRQGKSSSGTKSFSNGIVTLDNMIKAAEELLEFGSEWVLVKGGHISLSLDEVTETARRYHGARLVKQAMYGENMEILLAGQLRSGQKGDGLMVVDVLRSRTGSMTLFVRPRVESKSTHGTGCTLSSAIAAGIANGLHVEKAVEKATEYTYLGINAARPIGRGYGPLNHFHNTSQTLVPCRTPQNPYPLTKLFIEECANDWKDYVQHKFVVQLGNGTLPKESFVHFIKQDYLYLRYYARAYGLVVAKSSSFSEIDDATKTILNVLHEIGNHKKLCAKFDVTVEELETAPESIATTAYGAYLIDCGVRGDSATLIMALMACLLGYGEVGLWLEKEALKEDSWVVLEGNPYRGWMEEYAGDGYQGAVRLGLETIENLATNYAPSRRTLIEWKNVWQRCTRLEKGFWDMAMNLS